MNYSLCGICRGRNFCGKPCLILKRLKMFLKNNKFSKHENTESVSPFVGRYNYPNINIGILSTKENAEISDAPKYWYEHNYNIPKILGLRLSVLHSRDKTNVKKYNKITETIQEISMSKKPVDLEIVLKNKPKTKIKFSFTTMPIGNVASLNNIKICSNVSVIKDVEKVVSDELKASDMIVEMYRKRISVEKITNMLSVGLLGKSRKLVPTRWSITAVDDIVSKSLLKEIKCYKIINEYFVFHNEYLGNHYEILMIPQYWSFEVIEAKLPGSCWNLFDNKPRFYADYEFYKGRSRYAEYVGGGYYAARIGVCEYLKKIKQQATVIVFREVKPEYFAPIGVWQCRENVRHAFLHKESFTTLNEALNAIRKRLTLPLEMFLEHSTILNFLRMQRKLDAFV